MITARAGNHSRPEGQILSRARHGGAHGQNTRNPEQRAEGVAETRPPAPQTAADGPKGTYGANNQRCAEPNHVRRKMIGGSTRPIRTAPTIGTLRPGPVFSFVIPFFCLSLWAQRSAGRGACARWLSSEAYRQTGLQVGHLGQNLKVYLHRDSRLRGCLHGVKVRRNTPHRLIFATLFLLFSAFFQPFFSLFYPLRSACAAVRSPKQCPP